MQAHSSTNIIELGNNLRVNEFLKSNSGNGGGASRWQTGAYRTGPPLEGKLYKLILHTRKTMQIYIDNTSEFVSHENISKSDL